MHLVVSGNPCSPEVVLEVGHETASALKPTSTRLEGVFHINRLNANVHFSEYEAGLLGLKNADCAG